jgi:hypothetical protein
MAMLVLGMGGVLRRDAPYWNGTANGDQQVSEARVPATGS